MQDTKIPPNTPPFVDLCMPMIEVDGLIHTQAHPFCADATCACHHDADLLAPLIEQVRNGLLTFAEAAHQVAGGGLLSTATPVAPWKPLEPEMAVWVAFAEEALPTCASAFDAVAHAYTALAAERHALHSSEAFLHSQQASRSLYGLDSSPLALFLVHEDEEALTHLRIAADAWYEVARAVERYGSELSCSADSSLSCDLYHLVERSLYERARVETIRQHLLVAQCHSYASQRPTLAKEAIPAKEDAHV